MNKINEFHDLVRFSAQRNAAQMVKILEDSNIAFRVTKLYSEQGTPWPWSKAAVVIQVTNRDFNRAEAMLIEYRKTMGVPFS